MGVEDKKKTVAEEVEDWLSEDEEETPAQTTTTEKESEEKSEEEEGSDEEKSDEDADSDDEDSDNWSDSEIERLVDEEMKNQPQIGGDLKGLASAFKTLVAKSDKQSATSAAASTQKDDAAKKPKSSDRLLLNFEKEINEKAHKENEKRRAAKALKAAKTLKSQGIEVLPNAEEDMIIEKQFRNIATRDIVQLFNSIHKAQREMDIKIEEEKPKKWRRMTDKQRDFVDLIRNTKDTKRSEIVQMETEMREAQE